MKEKSNLTRQLVWILERIQYLNTVESISSSGVNKRASFSKCDSPNKSSLHYLSAHWIHHSALRQISWVIPMVAFSVDSSLMSPPILHLLLYHLSLTLSFTSTHSNGISVISSVWECECVITENPHGFCMKYPSASSFNGWIIPVRSTQMIHFNVIFSKCSNSGCSSIYLLTWR